MKNEKNNRIIRLDRIYKPCDNNFKIISGSMTILEEEGDGQINDQTTEEATEK